MRQNPSPPISSISEEYRALGSSSAQTRPKLKLGQDPRQCQYMPPARGGCFIRLFLANLGQNIRIWPGMLRFLMFYPDFRGGLPEGSKLSGFLAVPKFNQNNVIIWQILPVQYCIIIGNNTMILFASSHVNSSQYKYILLSDLCKPISGLNNLQVLHCTLWISTRMM